jgi:hypothetical protein
VSLYTLMQVISVTVFEKAAIESLILQVTDDSGLVMGNGSKNVGTGAFFSCCGSTRRDSLRMCRRHPYSPI